MAESLKDSVRLLNGDKGAEAFVILVMKDDTIELIHNTGQIDPETFWLKAEREIRVAGEADVYAAEEEDING